MRLRAVSDTNMAALRQWLEDAWADYHRGWSLVDQDLHAFCRHHGHDKFKDVYAKVTMVNRMYLTGLSRPVRTVDPQGRKLDGEAEAARCLVDNHELLKEWVHDLLPLPEGGRAALRLAVEAHGRLTTALTPRLGYRPCSFVSKYLHFHCPGVPIYDTRADASIKVVTSRLVGQTDANTLARPDCADPYYYPHARRFLELWEVAEQSRSDVTVKMLDLALWSGAPLFDDSETSERGVHA